MNEPTTSNETHAGILVLIRKDYDILSKQIITPGRIIVIEINHTISQKKYTITVIYGVHRHKTNIRQIREYCTNLSNCHDQNTCHVTLGDFNFVHNSLDRPNGIQIYDNS